MPSPARSTGTMTSFLPAITGASISVSGVAMRRVVSGRPRVTS